MTSECPQCQTPIPRESSRFCNQCGADLRPFSGSLGPHAASSPTSAPLPGMGTVGTLTASDLKTEDREALPNGAQFSSPVDKTPQTNMVSAQNETKNDTHPPSIEATLHILQRDGSVIERDITKAETLIGKGPQNDIILTDPSVSGTHAMIAFAGGRYTISDLGSRNGTLLNETRVSEQRQLSHGDLIKMG